MKKIKALLYCTKAKPYLYRTPEVMNFVEKFFTYSSNKNLENCTLNGTIPCECEIEVDEIHLAFKGLPLDEEYATFHFREKELLKHSCLTFDELDNYLQGKNGYALHISNLKVFDKPKALSDCDITIEEITWDTLRCDSCMDFKADCKECYENYLTRELKKAPQNMMNVWFNGERYVLISIQPQWLCKILNGEKDIEIRKQVLNCMKN